jgi:hypothetical protein
MISHQLIWNRRFRSASPTFTNKGNNKIIEPKMSKMCEVKLFLTFASLGLVLLWQLFYLFFFQYCYKYYDSQNLWALSETAASDPRPPPSQIRAITKLSNSEQYYKGKVKTHKYILWQLFYLFFFQYCYKYYDSQNLWAVMKAGGLAL